MTLGELGLYRMLIRTASPAEKRNLRRLAAQADEGNVVALCRFQGIMNRLLEKARRPAPAAREGECHGGL